MAKTSLIDLDHLDRYVAGDRSLRDEILSIFEEQAEMWTRMLDPRAEDSAWKDAAHALKGASRGVGAWQIGDICEHAETLVGSTADSAMRVDAVDELRNVVRNTVAEVRRLREL
ncbi:Hpt domain-containing protein [Parvularcula sp. LCG005]|uniref:Hpt domain-containing protein n=1 Tax=Parvularcula sp. LCG005 TaxID=3078805 RepID=UPI0029423A8F|nr:Hpt domain-containing protein [Parvularcula sp. LCG005]WOI54764.1 Hpt domain-containing protein [Parvularcula sp. LCG005]